VVLVGVAGVVLGVLLFGVVVLVGFVLGCVAHLRTLSNCRVG